MMNNSTTTMRAMVLLLVCGCAAVVVHAGPSAPTAERLLATGGGVVSAAINAGRLFNCWLGWGDTHFFFARRRRIMDGTWVMMTMTMRSGGRGGPLHHGCARIFLRRHLLRTRARRAYQSGNCVLCMLCVYYIQRGTHLQHAMLDACAFQRRFT